MEPAFASVTTEVGRQTVEAAPSGVAPRRRRPTFGSTRLTVGLGLAVLIAASFLLRLDGQRAWLWIDEGISVGISSHGLTHIPGVLRQDGSPPLYYLLLHLWIAVFGRTEVATHALSFVLALATIPVAYWAGRSLFGRRAAWIAAFIAAVNPFISAYASETRMYTLVMFLGMLASAFFLHAFVRGRHAFVVPFGLTLAALMYTHTWGLYFGGACGLAWLATVFSTDGADRQTLFRRGLMGFGIAGVLYLPWLPTLLYQAAHTGAPWSSRPSPREAVSVLDAITGDVHERVLVAFLLTGGVALAGVLGIRRSIEGQAARALLIMAVGTIAAGWLAAQISPAWSPRYAAVVLPPLLLAVSFGLARAGRIGVVALVLILLFWIQPLARLSGLRTFQRVNTKSIEKGMVKRVRPAMSPGDLVVVTQLEETPVLHYYLDGSFRYADPTGPVADPNIADWRDAEARMQAATPARNLEPLVASLPVGNHVLLVCPRQVQTRHELLWFRLMDSTCAQWRATLDQDARMRFHPVPDLNGAQANLSNYVFLYDKVGA